MKWIFEKINKFPWGCRIVDESGREIIKVDGIAHSSVQKTREDFEDAIGFPAKQRPNNVAMIKDQESEVRLMAAAPQLRQLLHEAVAQLIVLQKLSCDSLGIEQQQNAIAMKIEEVLKEVEGEK